MYLVCVGVPEHDQSFAFSPSASVWVFCSITRQNSSVTAKTQVSVGSNEEKSPSGIGALPTAVGDEELARAVF